MADRIGYTAHLIRDAKVAGQLTPTWIQESAGDACNQRVGDPEIFPDLIISTVRPEVRLRAGSEANSNRVLLG